MDSPNSSIIKREQIRSANKENTSKVKNTELVTQLKTQLSRQKKTLSDIMGQNASLLSHLEFQERRSAEALDEIKKLKPEIQRLDKDNKHLTFKQKYLEQEKQTLSRHVQILNEYVKKLEVKMKLLNPQWLQELQKEKNTHQPHTDNSNMDILQVDHSQSFNDREKQYQQIISCLQKDLENTTLANSEYAIIRQSNTEELTGLETQNYHFKKEIEILRSQLKTQPFLSQEQDSQNDQTKLQNEQIILLQKKLRQSESILNNLSQQYEQIAQIENEQRQQLNDFEYLNLEKESVIQINEAKIKEMQIKLKQTSRLIQRITLRKKENNMKLTIMKQKISRKESISQDNLIQDLEELYLDNENLITETYEVEMEQETKEIDQGLEIIKRLESDIENQKLRSRELQSKLDSQRMTESANQLQIEKLQEQLENQRNSRGVMQKTFSDQILSLKRENQLINVENEKLKLNLQELEINRDSLLETVQRQEKHLQEIQLKIYRKQ